MGKIQQLNFLKWGIIIFLFLPILFQVIEIKEFTPLNGVQENKMQQLLDSTNSKLSWTKGSFQLYCDLYASENLVLKSPLIRLRNQIEFSFFDKINAQDIYHYNDVLFRFYTKNYHEGIHFMGENKAREQIIKLREIQGYLGKNIPILTIIAPSKTYFYAEKLPPINQFHTKKSNYKFLMKLLQMNHLHCIDFNSFFLKHKNSTVPIFGKGGIHWTSYASTIAMDSVVSYLTHNRGVEFQKPYWKMKHGFHADYDDHDLAQLLNVFYPPLDRDVKTVKFLNPAFLKKKIKALIISDSFFDVISKSGLRQQIFTNDSEYLYYFSSKKDLNNESLAFDKTDLLDKIKQFDCVIILNDIVNMENFSWGFIDEVFNQMKR